MQQNTSEVSEGQRQRGLELISGPPGSGKSTRLMAWLRESLARQDWSIRLLVPSATMSEHVRNQVAREGLILRRSTVTTLTRFLEELPLGQAVPARSASDRLLAELLERDCPEEYLPIRDSASFRGVVLDTIEALALAGAAAEAVPGSIGRVYGKFLEAAQRKGWLLRGQRLEAAAQWLDSGQEDGAALPHTILIDGFFNFATTELQFIEALARRCRVVVSLGTLEAGRSLREPAISVRAWPSREQEVLGIAAQVQELLEGGVGARRMGIVLRNPDVYAPLFENVFSRLGIPSRSYLGRELGSHPLVEFARDVLQAGESGWEMRRALRALRWNLTVWGRSETGDALEKWGREAMPAQGIAGLPLSPEWECWARELHTPPAAVAAWLRVFHLLAPPKALPEDEATAFRWSELGDAMQRVERLLQSAAEQFGAEERISVGQLWEKVECDLKGQVLRERDRRREVVHLMDLFESRQWELDVVFAPGLLEGEFPKRPSPDPLLSEETRAHLRMKTMLDREKEEDLLWQVLLTRAKEQLHLSYPRSSAQGEALNASPYLETLPVAETEGKFRYAMSAALPRSSGQLGETAENYRPERAWSATEFETYLACPFQHFARYGLKLAGWPALPGERLDGLLMGSVAHEALRQWVAQGGDLVSIAVRVFDKALEKARIPKSYRSELERLNLMRTMRLYEKKAPLAPPGWQSHLEEAFHFELQEGLEVRGQIDRYDLSPDGVARAYDYKYSKGDGLEEKYVQGGLYAMALGRKESVRQVESFSYVALRQDAQLTTFAGEKLAGKLQQIESEAKAIVGLVAAGKAPVQPADRNNCQYCDYEDLCRIRSVAGEDAADAGDAEEALTA